MTVQMPPLLILTKPDGSPDWEAVNVLARETILDVLREVGPLSGAQLERACAAQGFHPKVTFRARTALEGEGLVRRAPGMSRRRPAWLWSVVSPTDPGERRTGDGCRSTSVLGGTR